MTVTRLKRTDSDQRMMLALGNSPVARGEMFELGPSTFLGWCASEAPVAPSACYSLCFWSAAIQTNVSSVEGIPAEGFGGRRHAVHVLCFAGTGHLTRTDGARSLGSASDACHAGEGTDDAQAGEPDGQ
jgi:hypothetical protein